MPVNMNLLFPSFSYPFFISLPTMLSLAKVTLASKSSITSMDKSTGTNKAVTGVSDREMSMDIMKKEKKQIMELSDEEDDEEDDEEKGEEKCRNNSIEDDLKVNKI